MIAHPLSPYGGKHYTQPVELIDIYPTLLDLLHLPVSRTQTCAGYLCKPLDGRSLAPVVLGPVLMQQVVEARENHIRKALGSQHTARPHGRLRGAASAPTAAPGRKTSALPSLGRSFAISQVLRCAPRDLVPPPPSVLLSNKTHLGGLDILRSAGIHSNYAGVGAAAVSTDHGQALEAYRATHRRSPLWTDCNVQPSALELATEISLVGYSMRTTEYRYTAYFHYNRTIQLPEVLGVNAGVLPYEEELFDHRNETLSDFTHRELVNLAYRSTFEGVVMRLRKKLKEFIRHQF